MYAVISFSPAVACGAVCRRVLTAYARHNPSVGYCQGMNFVAAMLLLQLSDEEHAFWCLCALVEDVLPGYYSHAMVAAEVDQLVTTCNPLMRSRIFFCVC